MHRVSNCTTNRAVPRERPVCTAKSAGQRSKPSISSTHTYQSAALTTALQSHFPPQRSCCVWIVSAAPSLQQTQTKNTLVFLRQQHLDRISHGLILTMFLFNLVKSCFRNVLIQPCLDKTAFLLSDVQLVL